jgi:protein-L-isoaspartate(D-aspartate) O-methyltransferase
MPVETEAGQLRERMVAGLLDTGAIRSDAVAAAFAAVPREMFAPEAPLAAVYSSTDAITTKRDAAGMPVSSVSAPNLQADMLERAAIQPGARVLEIGSGGYNAALIAEIAGPDGRVVTVDIDPFVTHRAQRFLAQAGYPQVKVVLGDAEQAAAEFGPYDAIIVTVGVWDCPWGHLLVPGGRIVVPLEFGTMSWAIAFAREGDTLTGRDAVCCSFVAVQGAGARAVRETRLAGGAVLLRTDGGPEPDIADLDRALAGEPAEVWTGVISEASQPSDSPHLWLVTAMDDIGTLVERPDTDSGIVHPTVRWMCPALITADSFAYLTAREAIGAETHEFGVRGHGRHGTELAEGLAGQVQEWDRRWRGGPGPVFTLYPAGAAVAAPVAGHVFRKRHTTLVLSWSHY